MEREQGEQVFSLNFVFFGKRLRFLWHETPAQGFQCNSYFSAEKAWVVKNILSLWVIRDNPSFMTFCYIFLR